MNIAICFGNIKSSKEINIKYFVTVQILITKMKLQKYTCKKLLIFIISLSVRKEKRRN